MNQRDTTDRDAIIAGGRSVFAEALEGLGFNAERAKSAVRSVQFRRRLAEEVQLRNKLQTKILEPARQRLAKIENKPVLDLSDLKEREDLIALLPDQEAEQHRASVKIAREATAQLISLRNLRLQEQKAARRTYKRQEAGEAGSCP